MTPVRNGTPVAHERNPLRVEADRGRVRELDGVRGVAILFVLVYHALHRLPAAEWPERVVHKIASTGWAGVDLFFVLSGFLITGILLDARGSDGYFWRFYTRRALRILPLYFVFVVVALEVAPLVGLTTPEQAVQLQRAAPWYWAHGVNVLIAIFGWKAAGWYTGHLWSLALEEQFYLLWPALVFLLTPRALIRTLMGLIVTAVLLRITLIALHAPAMTIYALLPTRMDALATGALLAVVARDGVAWERAVRWSAPAGVILGAVALGVMYVQRGFDSTATLTQAIGYPAIAGVAAAVILSAVNAPAGSLRAFVWNHGALYSLGTYSYGLYVWHYPIVGLLYSSLLPGGQPPAPMGSYLPVYAVFIAATIALSFGVALVSWRVIEQPALQLKRFVPYRPKLPPANPDAIELQPVPLMAPAWARPLRAAFASLPSIRLRIRRGTDEL